MAEVLITQAEVRDALKLLCRDARNDIHKVGDTTYGKFLTPWDKRHRRINLKLDELDMLAMDMRS